MHQTRGSLRNPRNRRRWVPAACVLALALAYPAAAAAALGAPAKGNGSDPAPSHVLLAWGSGYGTAHGSQLVRVVQRRLAAAGDAPGPIDGRFGSLTVRAVVVFQASQGLQVDGIVGPETWAALHRAGQVLSPGAGSAPTGSQSVRILQRRLALAGYSPGPIDGHYGPLTAEAVRRFQAAHGLPANGIAGVQTLARIAQTVRPVHTAGRRGSPSPSPALVPLPHTAGGGSGRTPIPTGVERPGGRSSTPATALLGLLFVLGLALILIASRYARRRTGNRHSPTPSATGPANGAGPVGHDAPAPAAYARGDHRREATAPVNAEATAAVNGDATAAFNLGVVLEERGDLAGAEAAFRRADERGHGAAASNLGLLLEERGASAQAEAAYRRAVGRGDATAAFNLGGVLEERGELAGAEAAYRRADERGSGEVANLARAALLDLREALPQPSPTGAGGS